MDCLMRLKADRHKIVGIQHKIHSLGDVIHRDWVHVMNKNPSIKFMTGTGKIAAIVPQDNVAADLLPFVRAIKPLIEPAIKSKSGLPDKPMKLKVLKSFKKSGEPDQLLISPHS